MREHLPDPDECSLEDSEEQGDTQSYFFLRYRDSATVVYKVAAKGGKITSVRLEVYHGESGQEETDEQRWLVKPKGGTVSSVWLEESSVPSSGAGYWRSDLHSTNALSSDSSEESTGEIGDLKLAVWRRRPKTADYLGFRDLRGVRKEGVVGFVVAESSRSNRSRNAAVFCDLSGPSKNGPGSKNHPCVDSPFLLPASTADRPRPSPCR